MRCAANNDQTFVQSAGPLGSGDDVVIERKGNAFEHGPIEMSAGVVKREPDKSAAGLGVPDRTALAHEIRQKNDSIRAGRDFFGTFLQ